MNKNNLTLTVKHDPEPLNPRKDHDNIGTIAAFHSRYAFDEANLTLEEAQALTTDPDYITLPVYMYEHSGITVSTSPFSCSWDSGQLGVIFTSRLDAHEYLGRPDTDEEISKYLEGEVETWASYLEGEVYSWVIHKGDTFIDACHGYIGEEEYCRKEGEQMLEHYIAEFDKAQER